MAQERAAAGGEAVDRARVWTVVCVVAASLTAGLASFRLLTEAPGWAVGELVAAGMMLLAAHEQAVRRRTRRSVGLVIAGASGSLVVSLAMGDPLGPIAVAWYGMVPLFSTVALGRVGPGRWSALLVTAVCLCVGLAAGGWPLGARVEPASVVPLVLLFTGFGALTWSYESVQAGTAVELDATKRALVDLRQRTDDLIAARDQFVKNVSHEFRTPLNHILGATQLLGSTDLNEEQKELVAMAETSGGELLHIIDGALSMQDLERGHIHLEQRAFALQALMDRVSAHYGQRARAKGLDFSMVMDAGLPPQLVGDPDALQRVLSNLLDNAIAFTDQGRVGVHVQHFGEGALGFEVEDTGVGIETEHLERIFEPFRQANESDARPHGGLGTGLAVSRHLARLMGGDVRVSSVRGRGSRFRFTARASLPGDHSAPTSNTRLRSERVILAEANPRARAAFLSTLEQLGMQAVGVGSAEELAVIAIDARFDFAFIDVELAEQPMVRAHLAELRRGGTYLVALTRSDTQDLPAGGVFHDHLPKPLRREQVVEMGRQRVDARRRAAS